MAMKAGGLLLAELISILLPVYLCAGTGFLWARMGRAFDTRLISELIMEVGAPCLIFGSLAAVELDPRALGSFALAVTMASLGLALLGAAILRPLGLAANTYLAPIVFMNAGNMGIPLCYFAFGEEGLAYAVCFFAIVSLIHFTLGQWLWSGTASAAIIFRTPLAYAAVAGAAVVAFDVEVPRWLERTTGLLGDFTVPLMQFSLGVSLSRMRLSDVPRGVLVAGLRMGLGLAVGFGLTAAFAIEGVARGVFILDCAMPVAVFNYMMAERFGRSPDEVASTVVLSTLLAFATVPLLLAYLLP